MQATLDRYQRSSFRQEWIYGYTVEAEPKELIQLINNEGFIPSFDKEGRPIFILWSRRRLENAVVELTAKGRIVLRGEEV